MDRGVLLSGVLLVLISSIARGQGPHAAVNVAEQVQGLLSARCLKCHGPDESEGGLRFVDRESVMAELDSGRRAVVPGEPANSELLRRVATADLDERMPPEGSPLTSGEVDLVRRWIEAGAEWPQHWSYLPLAEPRLPSRKGVGAETWSRSPIDISIGSSLTQRGLSPSPPADKRVLLRRVYFDLLGLPPTIEQIEAFVSDNSPNAYEKVVDELLASPRYGERWARHWMDVVHYAETHGHDQDRPREHAWPYRDYLIQSFNSDKPYDRFVAEQIAGDVLFPGDSSALIATGFLATGPWDESSLRDIQENTIDREIARYLDRDDIVTTVMSTFASSTVHCARCHDHKFDPISQRDYYGLQAVFAATDKANRAFDTDPQVAARRRQLAEALTALPQRLQDGDGTLLSDELGEERRAWERRIREQLALWRPLQLVEVSSEQGSQLTRQEDGSVLAGGTRPEKDVYTIVAQIDRPRLTGLRLEVMTDPGLPKSGPGRQDNGNLHLNEITVSVLGTSEEGSPVALQNPRADFNQSGWTIEKSLDNNPGTAWGIYPRVGEPHVATFSLQQPLDGAEGTLLRIQLHQVHGGGHLIGRFRLSGSSLEGELPVQGELVAPELAAIIQTAETERTERQRLQLAAAFLTEKYRLEQAALPPLSMVYCGSNQFNADGTFRPAAEPRTIQVLQRGDVRSPLEPAAPRALNCLQQLPGQLEISHPEQEGKRRAALAAWLTDERNVLTWRSIANRIWLYHFGRGLVDTPNDFGRMGSPPTHPWLLDWLAVRLQQSGGSLKQLHREIVTSAVYRQSSETNETAAAIDADNRYLWRMNRQRLDAECIRDAVLAVSSQLDLRMGGPSVRQFIQSPGIHVTPVVDYVNFDVDAAANRRRSVYRFVFRTLPDPFMEALDCPDASQLTPQRNSSMTALQALAMLNDKVIVRQCDHIAARAAQDGMELNEQVRMVCRRIFGRDPAAWERDAIVAYAQQHGLANACRFLVNSNEFIFVD